LISSKGLQSSEYVMNDSPKRLTQLGRILSGFTRLRPGKGRSVLMYFVYALIDAFFWHFEFCLPDDSSGQI
jgi:hypothetical protein